MAAVCRMGGRDFGAHTRSHSRQQFKIRRAMLLAIRDDQAKFDALKKVVLIHATDPVDVDKNLTNIEAQSNILGSDGVVAKKAEFLYRSLQKSNINTSGFLLFKNGIIPEKWYRWYAQEWRSKTTASAVALLLVLMACGGLWEARRPDNLARYYAWRLHKDNATDYDHCRARQNLIGYLNKDAYEDLGFALRIPNLPVKTADNILGLMLETYDTNAAKDANLSKLLREGLRTENSDIRLRIYKVLMYCAGRRGLDTKAMAEWQPDAKDTPIRIDEMIRKWENFETLKKKPRRGEGNDRSWA